MNNAIYSTDDRDWLVLNNEELPVPEFSYSDKKIAYEQRDIQKNSCTLHGTITVVSNNFGIEFSLEDRKNIYALAKERGFQDSWGWNMADAVKCVSDWVRENKNLELAYYRVNWQRYEEITKLGFGIVTGYKLYVGMEKDKSEDGVLGDDMNYYGKETGAHLVSFWNIDNKLTVVNNYPSTSNMNVFELGNLEEMVKNDVIFRNGYIFTLKNKIMTNSEQKIKEAFTVLSREEMRKIAIEWNALEAFTAGLKFIQDPATYQDLRQVIALGRMYLILNK